MAADPVPILGNIAGNQLITAQVLADVATTFGSGFIEGAGQVPANVAAAVDKIAAGEIEQGVGDLASAFLAPIVGAAFPLLLGPGFTNLQAVLRNPLANATNVVEAVVSIETLVGVGLPLLFEVIAPVLQVGVTAQAVYDGIEAGDFEAVANALISFPGDMANTILNGSDNAFIGNGGLLGENGLVNSLLSVREIIADAIKPPDVAPAMALRAPEALETEATEAEAESEVAAELVASVPESDDPGQAPAAVTVATQKAADTVVLDVEVEATEADEPATVAAEVPTEDLAVEVDVEAGTETVDAAEDGQAQTATEAKVERKSALTEIRERRAEARAERQAQRAEARAERQAKRAERKAEREAKRAERRAERAAAKSDSGDSE